MSEMELTRRSLTQQGSQTQDYQKIRLIHVTDVEAISNRSSALQRQPSPATVDAPTPLAYFFPSVFLSGNQRW